MATSTRDQIFGFTNARKQSSHSYFSAAYIYKRDDLIIRNNNKLSLCSSFISLSLSFSCCVLKICTGDIPVRMRESLGETRALSSQHPSKHTLILKARLMLCVRGNIVNAICLSRSFLILSLYFFADSSYSSGVFVFICNACNPFSLNSSSNNWYTFRCLFT